MKRCLMMLCLAFSGVAMAQAPGQLSQADLNVVNRIRAEAFQHSQVMAIEQHLTEVIGPRLTNSPQNIAANAWARGKFTEWGLANVHSEPFADFGRGWEYTYASVQMLTPHKKSLFALPEAWTPGTDGWVAGEALQVSIKSAKDLAQYKGKLAGKIVLLDAPRDFSEKRPDNDMEWQRYSPSELSAMHTFEIPGEQRTGGNPDFMQRYKAYMQLRKVLPKFLIDQGVLATLSISRRDDGILGVSGGGSRKAGESVGVPSLVMAAERYNEVARALERGDKVTLRINVQARFTDQTDQPGYNTLAEIPGTGSKRREVVMLGAHLDSWHAGTGAADNAAGVAVVMEAMRILKQLGIKPRRTIRAALWSGEEQGLIGSRAYVAQHFAEWQSPTDANGKKQDVPFFMRGQGGERKLVKRSGYDTLAAYFNLDNGSGRIRGIYAQQNMAVMPIFKAWLQPFHDVGATEVVSTNTGSTDHISFDSVGLPGFQFIQDRLDYFTKIHHTNLDTLEHVSPADLKQAAAIMAAFVYLAAQRDQMLPRKPLLRD